jgi:hypothetical protein
MHRFRTPELFLGCFLTVAVFATGMLFVNWPQPQQITQAQTADKPAASSAQKENPKSFWQKVAADPVAAFTLCLVGIAAAQAAFFVVQLTYMRVGMEDARKVATAAKVSADAALKSANAAEAALIANDRAWISIRADPIGPLVFEKDQIHIGIGFDLKNVGKSPATHLEIQAKLCADVIAAKNKGDEVVKSTRYQLHDIFGVVLFPDQEREDDWLEMQMPAAEFMDVIEATKTELAQQANPEWDGSTARPGIMVCATYRLAGSRKPRHTVILYEVRHIDDKHMGWDGSEGETGLVEFRLVQSLMSGQVT